MQSGRLIHRVIVMQFAIQEDQYGEDEETWTEIGSRLGHVIYGKGAERREAAMKQASQSATFQFRMDALTRAIAVKDRLVFAGTDWDVAGVAPNVPRRGWIEFTAIGAKR